MCVNNRANPATKMNLLVISFAVSALDKAIKEKLKRIPLNLSLWSNVFNLHRELLMLYHLLVRADRC